MESKEGDKMFTKKELIEGIKCEKCMEENSFGEVCDDRPENLYLYIDYSGSTRCFCIKHMTFYTEKGAQVDYTNKDSKVGYGAVLKSELLKEEEK